jgi:hypothetical protein
MCEKVCDLLDDELLAIHSDPAINPGACEPEVWVEQVFRESLAVIQARSGTPEIGEEGVLAFLRARASSTLRRVSRSARKAVVSSGLPLSVALRVYENLDVFRGIADFCDAERPTLRALSAAVHSIEEWARTHAGRVTGSMPGPAKLDALRDWWLSGTGLQALTLIVADAQSISRDLYGYQLPWIIHAASQQLRGANESEKADALARLALLVELGVPTDLAARIFLAGVRSRAAATELAALDARYGSSVGKISRKLRNPKNVSKLRPLVSAAAAGWLDLMVEEGSRLQQQPVPEFSAFKVKGFEGADTLHVRKLGGQVFLATLDGRIRTPVRSSEKLPFDQVANDHRVAFRREGTNWQMEVRDPRCIERS